MPWDGTGLISTEMPDACFYNSLDGPVCAQIIAAPAGSYSVDMVAYDACSSDDCQCDTNGTCFSDVSGNMAKPDPVTFEHPTTDLVQVTFGPCAFTGCPPGN